VIIGQANAPPMAIFEGQGDLGLGLCFGPMSCRGMGNGMPHLSLSQVQVSKGRAPPRPFGAAGGMFLGPLALEQSWLKWHHFNHAFCGKNKTIEPFH